MTISNMGGLFEYVIKGETPAKKNSRINLKNGRSIPSKRYQEWHRIAISELYKQKRPENPINTNVFIRLEFTHGDLRRRDSDNGCSSILDLLVDAQILEDDSWKIVKDLAITNNYKKGSPKCLITIQEI